MAAANPQGGTDTNLVWEAEGLTYAGLIAGNLASVERGVGFIFNASVLASGGSDGVKADASFWMHGAQLYSGGYGEGWVWGELNGEWDLAGSHRHCSPARRFAACSTTLSQHSTGRTGHPTA